jgi:hypothetical protein
LAPLGEPQKVKVISTENPRKENRRDSRKSEKTEGTFEKRGSKNLESANLSGAEEKLHRKFEDVHKPSQGSSGSLNKIPKGGSPKGKEKN